MKMNKEEHSLQKEIDIKLNNVTRVTNFSFKKILACTAIILNVS